MPMSLATVMEGVATVTEMGHNQQQELSRLQKKGELMSSSQSHAI